MLRRGVAVLLVVAAATVAAMATPHEAQAYSGPSPWTDLATGKTSSSLWTHFKDLLAGRSGPVATQYGATIAGESTTTANGMNSMLTTARVGSRFLPRLAVVATRISIPLTVGYIGWRIYQHYDDDPETPVIKDLWLDADNLGKDALYNPVAAGAYIYSPGHPEYGEFFHWKDAAWVPITGSRCTPVGGSPCWALELYPEGTTSWSATDQVEYQGGLSENFASDATGFGRWTAWLDFDDCEAAGWTTGDNQPCYGAFYSLFGGADFGMGLAATRTLEHFTDNGRQVAGATPVEVTSTVTPPGQSTAITYRRVLLPEEAFGGALRTAGDGELTDPDLETEYEVPEDAGDTEPDADGALAALDTPCGRMMVNYLLGPYLTTDVVWPWLEGCIELAPESEPDASTFALPRPQANETYADYITRLQELGWLGTATLHELDPYDPAIGPEAVQKVGVTGRPGTWRRAAWPTRSPVLSTSADLELWHNPDDAPTVAPDPTDDVNPSGGPVIDNGSDCEPWLESELDLSPLSGVDLDGKFPFALFAWVGSILEPFSAVADAPNWTFDITIPATAVSGETELGEFTVDLEWADSYMSTVRTILTFVLWIGAVWFFATALLGLRAPGNPAEAVDEA
jgi:hypothetical protein